MESFGRHVITYDVTKYQKKIGVYHEVTLYQVSVQ